MRSLLWTGYRWDDTIALYDAKARFYDPYLNQFISPDSIVPNVYNPASLNRYSYALNNPVNLVDPSGHIAIGPWDILDVASFGLSLNDFVQDPSLANAGWLALDTVGLLPILPSVGMMRHAGKLDEVGDAARVARGVDEFGAGDEIIYYHTTSTRGAENIRLKGVDPFYGRAEVDFGQGFYVTPNRAQAEDWLVRKFKGEGTILEFRVSRSELESFKGLVFDEPNEAWQAFVTAHRTPGTPIHGYDFVEGALAIPRGDVWIPHKDPTYWQLSIHTEAAAQIFTKGLLP